MKLALAMIVKGTNDEAQLLRRCLENLAPHVDGIFITRTHAKGQKPNRAVGNVATMFGAHLSEFEWVDDFSAARNFNFSQVPKDYDFIMWTDADDMWRGLDKLRPTIEANPTVDGFGFWYLYDWDETKKPIVVHKKTMIVRNDGSAKWEGALHEDLTPNRLLEIQFVEGIERLHLTNTDRAGDAAKRNVRIAQKDLLAKPEDPRSYWNLGNSQLAVGDFDGAKTSFESFLELSSSDEEKYIIHQRLAEVYKALGKRDLAVEELQMGIGLLPGLPDAYLQLGYLFFLYGDLEKAEQYILQGLVKRPQVQKMIVFNPRDYDYNPMMLLAKVYFMRNRPDLMLPLLEGCLKIYPDDAHLKQLVKEGKDEKDKLEKALIKIQELQNIKDKKKLKNAIDNLPEEIRSHPAISVLRNQNFIKETSSGKDLVIYCGNTTHQWNPELFKTKGFGGSEEAVIHLAREFAKQGWNVQVYNNCGHKRMKVDSVEYIPFWEWNYRDKQDVVILWRWTKPLDADINAPKIFVDLHDVVPAGEFTEKRLERVTKVFVKSMFHRSLFPNVPDEKIEVIPNGFEMYYDQVKDVKKDPMLIINTSSPDRSMDVLPKLFKRVKERVPGAKMQWAYGWDIYKSSYANDPKKMRWMEDTIKEMREAGIEILGRLPQHEIAELYARGSVFAYPTEFAEIDCISVKKAQAVGCYPVTTDFGALETSNVFGYKVHSTKTKDSWAKPYQFHFGLEDEKAQDEWVDAVVEYLTKKKNVFTKQTWASQFRWEEIARRWNEVMAI